MARLVEVEDAPQQSTPRAPRLVGVEPRSREEQYKRAVGLSLRAPLDAVAGIASIPGNALTASYNLATGNNVPMSSDTYKGWIDSVFPSPETGAEKFSNVVATGMAGTGMTAAGAQAARPASELAKYLATQFGARTGAQVAGSATGAGATELALQNDVPAPIAVGAGILGGMAGSAAWDKGVQTGQRARNVVQRFSGAEREALQQRVAQYAQQAQVDLDALPQSVRAQFEATVTESLRSNRPLDPAAAARWLKLQAAGVKNPTRAMVSRDPQQWAEEDRLRKLSGVGAPLQESYDEAGNAIRANLTPEKAPGDATTGRAVKGGLQNVADDLNQKRNAAYDRAWSSPEAKEGVPVAGLRQWLEARRSFFKTNPEFEAALDELNRLAGDRPSLTKGNFELLKQSLNQAWKPENAGTIGSIQRQIDDAFLGTGNSSPFKEARQLNTIYRATVTDQGIVDDLLAMVTKTDPKIGPSAVYRTLMSAEPEQIKQVKNTLIVGGKGEVLTTLKDRVREELSTTLNKGETTADRAASFRTLFENNRERYAALFDPKEFARLQSAYEASQYVMQQVRGSAVNNSNTSTALIEYMRKAVSGAAPLGRALNLAGLGVPGTVIDAVSGSLANRQSAQQVSAALRPGLLAPAVAPDGVPLLTAGLLGPLMAGSRSDERSR